VTALQALVEPVTAGDPMSERQWVRASLRHLSRQLGAAGHPASPPTVRRLLAALGYRLHGNTKQLEAGAACERMVAEVEERFGRLDILCNLVGYFGPRGAGQMDDIELDRWNWMMDINLKSVFMSSRYALPAMLRSGGGTVVNTGTLAAVIGRGGGAYGGSKSGVLALTHAMASEYQPYGDRVNCVCPSATDTPMHWGSGGPTRTRDDVVNSVQGLSTPENIADAFHFLATLVSKRVTGHILMADKRVQRVPPVGPQGDYGQ
jgi:NAD(P)-dependent dehydrogenase (short-subunit alcohol dehydrogenase family)